mmetsp:Transcript_81430/g.226818  ORF Transcript_81430/g.226818 Transcript_81430/m.226818 type:complete len:287 (+) Transcript_81430:994-1854(+)
MSSGSLSWEMGGTVFGVATVGFAFARRSSVHFPLNFIMPKFLHVSAYIGCEDINFFFNCSSVPQSKFVGARFGCARVFCKASKLSSTSLRSDVLIVIAGLVSFCEGSTLKVETFWRTPSSFCVTSSKSRVRLGKDVAKDMPATSSPCNSPSTKAWLTPMLWNSTMVRPCRCWSATHAFSRNATSALEPRWPSSLPFAVPRKVSRGTTVTRPEPSITVSSLSAMSTFGACASPTFFWPSALPRPHSSKQARTAPLEQSSCTMALMRLAFPFASAPCAEMHIALRPEG